MINKTGVFSPLERGQFWMQLGGQYSMQIDISATQYHRYIHPGMQPLASQIAPTASTAFVKVKNPLATQPSILHLKLIRKDGATLNCYYPDTKTLHQTMQWFLES